ncbi:unnamed protein product [Adineta steineri]|uniref:Peptidase C74 domain-containing protein n=1 Tax=Adineta steineri TaxID=433720 RepID=A0A814VHN1_9BILA|nr:unnamed protein product [Adineta steineri]CAF1187228.1 unnamed protein product [Adineta steineri]CAF1503898.1 unnamed protein product [Adineta steineri]CAF3606349.1 unnamed protein product [Adineta steineri]CAF3869140.1 unnamed protein product [Adineta steineri]
MKIFTKIPGLMFVIHHTEPLVYQLQFQGSCQLFTPNINGFIRFLIDGRVLVRNYLLPNTDNRHLLVPELGSGVDNLDHIGGGMLYSAQSVGIAMSCPKSDLIYMPAGTHVVEVAARTNINGPMVVWGGELSVQLTQYDPAVSLALSHPIVR